MNTKPTYLLMGNAESPHLSKWAKELTKYVDLYVLSFQGLSTEMLSIVSNERCFAFRNKVKVQGGNIHLLKLLPKVKRIFDNLRPTFINAHYLTSYGFLAALAKPKKAKLILSAWGSDVLVTPFESYIKRKLTQYTLKNAALVTSDSQYMTEKIKLLNPQATVLTFPFGVEALPDCNFDEKNPNLFFSNRALTENYRIDLVLEHFATICKSNSEAVLFIANDGIEKERLMNKTNELRISEKVKWLGYLNSDEQAEIYRKTMFFFSLPKSDATSVSLLEAMAYGCVPIVSDIPANREWITNLENGIIVEQGANIASTISKLSCSLIFNKNRTIIQERALFPRSIKDYIEYLLKI